MKKSVYFKAFATSASIMAVATASAAFAQQEPTSGAGADVPPGQAPVAAAEIPPSEADDAEIVVTGTRIRSPNLESPNPVTSLDSQALAYTGETSVQEMVKEVGSLVGSEGESEVSSGENVLNLRNLGANRTLVLIDGQRFIGGFAGSTAVDTNVIPPAMIERVDVLTGGASAIYGADAVTGVVNFVLKKDFDGLAFDAQYGDAEDGDFRDQVYAVTAGKNFADGRGNLTLNYTYGERPLTLATARPQSSVDVHEQIDNLNGSTPEFVLAPGTRESFFTEGGARIDPFAIFSNGFNGDGTPFEHGVNIGSFAGTGEIGGDGLPNWILFAQGIRPSNERHIVTAIGQFEVSEAFTPYVNFHYSDVQNQAVDQHTLTVGMPTAVDNAFLPANIVTAAGGAPIFFNRWDIDSGFENSIIDKETLRAVVGARGQMTEHLGYDVSANFGRVDRLQTVTNNRMFDRYIAAIDSVVDPVTGQVVCRSTIDPNSFTGLSSDFLATSFDPALGAVSFSPGAGGGCVPFDPFTKNDAANDAARAWIWIPTTVSTKNEQFVLQGYVNGDTGGFFNLPGGPASFVAGAEYRKETSATDFDELSGSTRTVASFAGRDIEGRFNVVELFGEVSLPLIEGRGPVFRSLVVDGAYRYSHYSTIGDTSTWKLGAQWDTVAGLTLRGTISSAVRAPNIQELFEPRTNTSTSLGQFDPCSTTNVTLGSATRQANCATALNALGVDPATFNPLLGTFFPALTGGNPNLQEETALTKTVGAVWRPPFISGLTLSVDYFDIELEDAVIRPNTQSIFNACYDAPTLDNQFCALIGRDASSGFANFVEIQSVNVATIRTSGVEFLAVQSLPTDKFGTFTLSASGTWLERLDIQKTPLPVLTDDKGLFNTDTGGSSPEWVLNFDLNWSLDRWDFNYGYGYSSSTLRPPLVNTQRDTAYDFIDSPYVKAFSNHNIQVGYQLFDSARIYGGVRNLTDEYPDKVRGSLNGPSGRQGFAGRTYYVGVNVMLDDIWN
ncbi:TonB-dependent receptor [Pacificimonas sp. WHA3]|uniref:TonB-dependent receptor n=1 Tax=Pacificimonas pallii TaxID=2827236 RepID=A0ABS6SEY8_9SPHN|nr:TonB-dependent receptor [Pacificimonas pallii]MBV7256970.1 TonB-dependent receptor [Pacificimonas pallii]